MTNRQYKYIPAVQFIQMAERMGVAVDVLEANMRAFDVLVDRQAGRMRSNRMISRRDRMAQTLY